MHFINIPLKSDFCIKSAQGTFWRIMRRSFTHERQWHLYRLNDGILGILYFTASRLIFIFYGKVFANTV